MEFVWPGRSQYMGNEIKYGGQWNRVLAVMKGNILWNLCDNRKRGPNCISKILKVYLLLLLPKSWCYYALFFLLSLQFVIMIPYCLKLSLLVPTDSWKLFNWFYGGWQIISELSLFLACFHQRWIEIPCQLKNGTAESCYTKQRWELYWKIWQFHAHVNRLAL